MDKPIKLFNTLFVLHKCDVVIQRVIDRTRKLENGELKLIADPEFLVDNATLIILQLNIFLDEYEKRFEDVENNYRQRVEEFKKIVLPIIELIKKWTELRKFRNLFIAHNCRDVKGNFFVPDITLYDVPKTTLDFHMISDYMKYIMQLMYKEFKPEIQQMILYIAGFVPPTKSEHNIADLNTDLEKMIDEVNALCQQYNKSYRLTDIMLYLPPDQ
jgi:hypothetical protein